MKTLSLQVVVTVECYRHFLYPEYLENSFLEISAVLDGLLVSCVAQW